MISSTRFLNDCSGEAPKLRVYLNLDKLADLRTDSVWPGLEGLPRYERLRTDGFEGVQLTNDKPPLAGAPLPHCGLDRINAADDADAIAAKHAERGDLCVTVHAGWGKKMTMRSTGLSRRFLLHPTGTACRFS